MPATSGRVEVPLPADRTVVFTTSGTGALWQSAEESPWRRAEVVAPPERR
jgi:hypothetical protein